MKTKLAPVTTFNTHLYFSLLTAFILISMLFQMYFIFKTIYKYLHYWNFIPSKFKDDNLWLAHLFLKISSLRFCLNLIYRLIYHHQVNKFPQLLAITI